MHIKFKDGTIKPCYNPKEVMLFKERNKAGWLFSFVMPADSMEIDEILTQENISDIQLLNDKGTQGYSKGSYEIVNSVEIYYDDVGGMAEVQLKRGIKDEL